MPRISVLSAWILVGPSLFVLAACSAPLDANASSESDVETTRPATPRHEVLVTVTSTADAPSRAARDRFVSERLPAVKDMLSQWGAIVPVVASLRMAMVDPSRTDHTVIAELYGADYATDAEALRTRVRDLPDDASIEPLAREIACRFPGLGRPPVLEGLNQTLALPRALLEQTIDASLAALLDPTTKANEVSAIFGRSSTTTYASPGSTCGFILFGEAPTSGVVGSRSEDTVLHEVGHFIDLTTRAVVRHRSEAPAPILTEAFADVISHVVTQRDCHKTRDSETECARTMSEQPAPMSSESDPYKNGQAIRFAAWQRASGKRVADVGVLLMGARDRALAKAGTIDGTWLLRKTTAEERKVLFVEDASVATRFVAELASQP